MSLDIHVTYGSNIGVGDTLKALVESGVRAVRFNMSHTDCERVASVVKEIKKINPDVLVGADLRGRKLRIGPLPGGEVYLEPGAPFRFVPMDGEALVSDAVASVNYPLMGVSVKEGDMVLLDDGALMLKVKETRKDVVLCVVERGGHLPQRSGLNIPDHEINMPALTDKDYNDIDGLSRIGGVDHLYLSYVERGSDVELLKEETRKRSLDVPVIAKIELLLAIRNIKEIARQSDAICIARGDLGVELPHAKILDNQRTIVRQCKYMNTPVLLAGEVMFSLVNRSVPFRAEVTDVVVALEQGVDGFILSDETAVGHNPVNAVNVLNGIIGTFYDLN